MKEQRDVKSHEAELVEIRMKESTHHQQLAHLQELKDTIGILSNYCVFDENSDNKTHQNPRKKRPTLSFLITGILVRKHACACSNVRCA